MGKFETPNLSSLSERWPSTYVARQEVERFTGGIVSKKYLANLDSRGEGPAGRIRVGRKIVYPVQSLVAWLEKRAKTVEKK